MIPVYMTTFPDGKRKRGNAFLCCIASLAQMTLDDLPSIDDRSPDEALNLLTDFLFEHEYVLEACGIDEAGRDQWFIGTGLEAKGKLPHAVVYFNGCIAHDPYPGKRGMASVTEFWRLRTMHDVAMENDPPARQAKTHL